MDSNHEKEFYPKLVFVLPGLLRNFPYAHNLFVNNYGGVELLSNVVKLHTHSVKLKTLVNDLIQEKFDIEATPELNLNNNKRAKKEQYAKIHLLENLVEKQWCANFRNVLETTVDHDTIKFSFLCGIWWRIVALSLARYLVWL